MRSSNLAHSASEHAAPEIRQAVVSPPRVIQFRGRPLCPILLDQVFVDQPLDGAVELRGPEAHLAIGALQDFLHNPVAVLFLVGERVSST